MERLPKSAAAGPLADYSVGQRVMTVEGFAGTVTEVLEGPADLTTIIVALDNGMGGGEYAEAELQPLNQSNAGRIDATVDHTAADDYPELGSILTDRLPPQITTRTASKTASSNFEALMASRFTTNQLARFALTMWHADGSGPLWNMIHHTAQEAEDYYASIDEEQLREEACEVLDRGGITVSMLNHRTSSVTAAKEADYEGDDSGVPLGVTSLYLPPVPPGEQRASTTPLTPKQKAGYDEGFAHGQEGITRNPSDPTDDDYWAGYEMGWAEGVTVYREPANTWDIEDLGKDQTADIPRATLPVQSPAMMASVHESGAFMDWMRDNAQPNNQYSYDWCRFRRNSHCWLPKGLNEEASKRAGYAVWIPQDRGICYRVKWDDQKKCPTGEPGPHSGPEGFTDATVAWEDGGQREGVPTNKWADPSKYSSLHEAVAEPHEFVPMPPANTVCKVCDVWRWDTRMHPAEEPMKAAIKQAASDHEFTPDPDEPHMCAICEQWRYFHPGEKPIQTAATFEFTASWKDIREKAKRIRTEGGVRIVAINDNVMVAHVKGDHGVYETEIVSYPGKRNAAAWNCGCKWSSYSWGRSGPWKKYEGRMCSHALALQYEAQSRGAHGRTLTEDEKQPAWMDNKHVFRPGDYDKNKQRYSSISKESAQAVCLNCADTMFSQVLGMTCMRCGTVVPYCSTENLTVISDDGLLAAERARYADLHPVHEQTDDVPPVTLLAQSMLHDGTRYAEIREVLLSLGVERPADIVRTARRLAKTAFVGRVDGEFHDIDIDDDGFHDETGEPIDPARIEYPKWHPTLGLDVNEQKVLTLGSHYTADELREVGQQALAEYGDAAWEPGSMAPVQSAKDERVPPSEHGDPRMQDAGVSVSKTKDGKYYVHTHRARGKYRDSVADIPDSEIEYIRSTGSREGDVYPFVREGAKTPPAVLYHYTSEIYLPAILSSGQLRLTESNINMDGSGPKVVWLTSTTDPGRNGLDGGFGKGDVRFTVEPDPRTTFHWPTWAFEHNISPVWYDALDSAGDNGSENWWVSTEPIPLDRVLTIEVNGVPYRTGAKKEDTPTVSGVALKAADTGRILMLQRGLGDEDDPAKGTWEFPGGHHEDGDLTSLHAGIREWEEEVGQTFPEGGTVVHTWRSDDGVYQGHVVVIPEEKAVCLHQGRDIDNPDDPDGDESEQVAWWDPEDAKKNPALREECRATPWGTLTKAASALHVEAASADFRAAAKALLEMARRNEPDTTMMLSALAMEYGGTMEGLEHRFKSEESLLRKMLAEAHEYDNNPGRTAINMSDSLRYTMLFPTGSYSRGVKAVLDDLQQAGYHERVKNYWQRGDAYNGINVAMMTPKGHPFELQFHTPESFDTKESKVHPLYEKWRTEFNEKVKAALFYKMRDLFDKVVQPPGVLNIPVLKSQPLPTVAAKQDAYRYLLLTELHGDAPTTVIRMDANSVVEVWKGSGWVTDSEYGRYFLLGEPRSEEIDEEQALALTASGRTASLSRTAGEGWLINGKPYSDGVWIEVEPDLWYRGAARGEIPSRMAIRREGDKWVWQVQVLTFIGAPHENTGWQKAKSPKGTAKTLEDAKERAMKSIRKDNEFFQRYEERQRARLGSIQTEANSSKDLLRMIQQARGDQPAPPGAKYRSADDLILDLGREWSRVSSELPPGLERGPMKMCFQNAFNAAMDNPDLIYCEGYAASIIPTLHAWVVDGNGTVYDPTWEKGQDYFGVAFNTNWLRGHILSQGYYGVFGADFPTESLIGLLRNGLPSAAINRTGAKTAAPEAMVEVSRKGDLWTWQCLKCNETQPGRGYRDKVNTTEKAEAHAMWCYDLDWGDTPVVREAGLHTKAMPVGPLQSDVTFDERKAARARIIWARCPVCAEEMHACGFIRWYEDGEIANIKVVERHQRRGLATELLRRARTYNPDVRHSDVLSDDGEAWAQAVGSLTKQADEGDFERRTLPLTALLARKQDMEETLDSHRPSDTPGEPIWVKVRHDLPGRYEIADGHHRVAEAIRRGQSTIEADIDPWEDDEPLQPPFYDFSQHHTGSLRVTADEDQCPYCSGDSLMQGGLYVCEDGHSWHPDEPAARAFHDGPGELQPIESSQFGQFLEIPALMDNHIPAPKEGSKMDIPDEFGSLFDEALADTHHTAAQQRQVLSEWGFDPTYQSDSFEMAGPNTPYWEDMPGQGVDDDPEAALPITYGDDDEADRVASLLTSQLSPSRPTSNEVRRSVGSSPQTPTPGPRFHRTVRAGGAARPETEEERGKRLLAYAEAVARGETPKGPNPYEHLLTSQQDSEITAAASNYLGSKQALKSYSPVERQAIIDEGEDVQAGNLDRLDIKGTHYEALAQTTAKSEDEDLWMLDGDPNGDL